MRTAELWPVDLQQTGTRKDRVLDRLGKLVELLLEGEVKPDRPVHSQFIAR